MMQGAVATVHLVLGRTIFDVCVDISVILVVVLDEPTKAHDHGIYAYDAYVLECARRYATPLLSLDAPQCELARKLGIQVLEVES